MKYHKIGNSDLKVSKLCLGTMTFGEQNTEQEAWQQLDYAIEHGINFIDTAEMYPVPGKAETQGRTESYIGNWLTKQKRDKLVVATKITGPKFQPHLRDGQTSYRYDELISAVDNSLRRLKTDYIDLYQLHWPVRETNFFGKANYDYHQEIELDQDRILETLEALTKLMKTGKVRYVGVSNETAWGISQFQHYATTQQLTNIITIQNPYSLLNRLYEQSLAEFSHRSDMSLLAYSPLAFGTLSGKYRNGQQPNNARLSLFPVFSRYNNPNSIQAIEKYYELAQRHNLSLTQMSLAFVNQQPFVASNIIGATNLDQLAENIGSIDIKLSPELLDEINAIHQQNPNPSP